MFGWFRKKNDIKVDAHKGRLLRLVLAGLLKPRFLVLCPNAKHVAKYASVLDIPNDYACPCGETHHVVFADIEVTFDVCE